MINFKDKKLIARIRKAHNQAYLGFKVRDRNGKIYVTIYTLDEWAFSHCNGHGGPKNPRLNHNFPTYLKEHLMKLTSCVAYHTSGYSCANGFQHTFRIFDKSFLST